MLSKRKSINDFLPFNYGQWPQPRHLFGIFRNTSRVCIIQSSFGLNLINVLLISIAIFQGPLHTLGQHLIQLFLAQLYIATLTDS